MKVQVSAFMLERYRLGELDPQDAVVVKEALAADDDLRLRLEKLDESDRELRLHYPAGFFGIEKLQLQQARIVRKKTMVRFAGLAALIIAGVIVPVLYFAFFRNSPITAGRHMAQNELETQSGLAGGLADGTADGTAVATADRPKGATQEGSRLSVYLKGNDEFPLGDKAMLEEGNTVQLAYTAPAGDDYYGVIFSVDGRSVVTMHYPYRRGQNTLLVSGRRTFLNEAYTLDDAPDFEVFVMVVSGKPLDAEEVIRKARGLAGDTQAIQTIVENSTAAFEGCEVETVTVLKKQ